MQNPTLLICILILPLQLIGINQVSASGKSSDEDPDKIYKREEGGEEGDVKPIDEDDGESILDYIELGDGYQIIPAKFDWKSAQSFCSKCVGKFATFESEEAVENIKNALYDLSFMPKVGKTLRAYSLAHRYWIGLTNEGESEWHWTPKPEDNEPLLASLEYIWETGQPDNYGGNENCGGFWNPVYHLDEFKEGKGDKKEFHSWNDFPCDKKYYFICQEGNPDDDRDEECKRLKKGEKPKEEDYEVDAPTTAPGAENEEDRKPRSDSDDAEKYLEEGEEPRPSKHKKHRRRKKHMESEESDSEYDSTSSSETDEKKHSYRKHRKRSRNKKRKYDKSPNSISGESDEPTDYKRRDGDIIVIVDKQGHVQSVEVQ